MRISLQTLYMVLDNALEHISIKTKCISHLQEHYSFWNILIVQSSTRKPRHSSTYLHTEFHEKRRNTHSKCSKRAMVLELRTWLSFIFSLQISLVTNFKNEADISSTRNNRCNDLSNLHSQCDNCLHLWTLSLYM